MAEPDVDSGAQVQQFLRAEEIAAQRTAFIGRTLALLPVVPLVTFLTPWPGPVMTYLFLAGFAALGWLAWHVARASWGRAWHQYALVSADFALLTAALLLPNPFVPLDYPPQFALRFGSFVYVFVLLAGLAYVYQPRLVLWGGISAAVSWTIGVLILLLLPDTVWRAPNDMTFEGVIALMAEPTFVDVGVRTQEVVVLLTVAGLLALAVRRSRRVVLRQARLARERENLGRYFPRKTASLLAARTDPFPEPKEHHAAVLFADLVAFTSWSEKHSAHDTIGLLREVHGILAEVVFRHNGTLDKFIGDGVMATFGTPEPSSSDASDALACMIGMQDAFDAWRDGQAAKSLPRLAIGLHYGPVVIGNIGSARRLEFAVLGDAVNIASRLEGATRALGCRCLVSAAVVAAAEAEGQGTLAPLTERLTPHGPLDLRGREGRIEVYTL